MLLCACSNEFKVICVLKYSLKKIVLPIKSSRGFKFILHFIALCNSVFYLFICQGSLLEALVNYTKISTWYTYLADNRLRFTNRYAVFFYTMFLPMYLGQIKL